MGGPCWRPGRPKRSIVASLAPKKTPKYNQKWIQKRHKKGVCSKTRESKFGPLFTTLEPCRPPPKRLLFGQLGVAFSLLFSSPPKELPKNQHKRSIWRLWLQNDPQSVHTRTPKGDPNPSKIVAKSSLSHRGRPPATFDVKSGPGWGYPPKIHLKSTEK